MRSKAFAQRGGPLWHHYSGFDQHWVLRQAVATDTLRQGSRCGRPGECGCQHCWITCTSPSTRWQCVDWHPCKKNKQIVFATRLGMPVAADCTYTGPITRPRPVTARLAGCGRPSWRVRTSTPRTASIIACNRPGQRSSVRQHAPSPRSRHQSCSARSATPILCP